MIKQIMLYRLNYLRKKKLRKTRVTMLKAVRKSMSAISRKNNDIYKWENLKNHNYISQ